VISVRVAGIVAAAAAAGFVSLTALKQIYPPTWAQLLAVAIVASVAIGDQIRGIWVNARRPRRNEFAAALDRALTVAVLDVSDATCYDKRRIGVSAWQVRNGMSRCKLGMFTYPRRLERLHRVGRQRFTDYPQPSSIIWTKRKGVIGLCWQQEGFVHRDLREVVKLHGGDKFNPASYEEISPTLRMGMDKREFHMMIGKYGEVAAMPIMDVQGRFLGCIAVDIPVDACDGGEARLSRESAKEVTAATAQVVGGMLKRQ
jgi:hypothetical protein